MILHGDCIEILIAGKWAVTIDAEDLPRLNNGKGWGVYKGRARVCFARKGKAHLIHRLIMDAPDGMSVDHINGNTLDNRKINLRVCSQAENSRNRVSKNQHGFKGVMRNRLPKLKKQYRATITYNYRAYHSRYFSTPEEAAIEYDKMATKYHGDFAKLNFPKDAA